MRLLPVGRHRSHRNVVRRLTGELRSYRDTPHTSTAIRHRRSHSRVNSRSVSTYLLLFSTGPVKSRSGRYRRGRIPPRQEFRLDPCPVPVPRGRRSRRVAVVARRHGPAPRTGATDRRHRPAPQTGATDRRHRPAPQTAHLHYRSDRCNEQVGASADPVTRTDQVGTGPGRPGRRCGPVRRDRTSRDQPEPAGTGWDQRGCRRRELTVSAPLRWRR